MVFGQIRKKITFAQQNNSGLIVQGIEWKFPKL